MVDVRNPFTYRSFDLKTFAPLDTLPLMGVSFGDQVDNPGSMTASLDLLDVDVQKLAWERASRPNMTLILIDEVFVAQLAGPDQSIVKLTCAGTTATCETTSAHGYHTGQIVEFDGTDSHVVITNITDDGSGFCRINIPTTSSFTEGDELDVVGNSVAGYNVVHVITNAGSGYVDSDTPFTSVGTGGILDFDNQNNPSTWNVTTPGIMFVDGTHFSFDISNLSFPRTGTLAVGGTVGLAKVTKSRCGGGYIVSDRHYSKGKAALTLSTIDSWLGGRLQAIDYSNPDPSAIYWAANPADPTVIAAQLVYDAQQAAITCPGLGPLDCRIGGNGTVDGTRDGIEILINGDPPPNIGGGDALAFLFSGSNTIRALGLNSGLVDGAAIGDGGINVPVGTTVISWVQKSRGPYTASAHAKLKAGSNTTTIQSIVRPVPGEILVATGIAPGATILGVTPLGGISYKVLMSAAATSSHAASTTIISPWFQVVMSHNATADTYETVNYSITAGHAPTPVIYWISTTVPKTQFRNVHEIVNTLSQMGHNVGFDFNYDVGYIEGTTNPEIVLNINYPRRGKSGSAVTLALSRGDLLEDIDYDEAGSQQELGLIETASKSGGVVTGVVNNEDLVTITGYPVYEGVQSRGKVNDRTMLNALAEGDLQLLQNPTATLTLVIELGTPDPETGLLDPTKVSLCDFKTGDDLIFSIAPVDTTLEGAPSFGPNNSPRFPNGMNFEWRINQWLAKVADSGMSTLTLTCGIPPTDTTVPPTPPPVS